MPTNYDGDPEATEFPSSHPGPNVAPTLSLPDDGDDLDVASVLQDFKCGADFIAWLTNRLVAGPSLHFRDDFVGSTGTTGLNRSLWSLAGNANESIVDDSANGACGACRLDATDTSEGGLTTLPLSIIFGLDGPGRTGDFRFTARIRTAVKDGNLLCGLNSGTSAHDAYVLFADDELTYKIKVGTATTLTAIAPNTTGYDTIDIFRNGGLLTIMINDVVAYAPTLFPASPGDIIVSAGTSITGDGDVYVDSMSLYYDRTAAVL